MKDEKKNEAMDMTLKDLSLDEIIRQLTVLKERGCTNWKVRIINSHGVKSCVGKILAVGSGDEGTVALLPVPEDINSINAITRMMAMMCCEKAMNGQNCNACPDLPACEHMKRFDDNWKLLFESDFGEKDGLCKETSAEAGNAEA